MADGTALKNFVADSSDRSAQDILSKLRFIAKLLPGERVNVGELKISEDGYYSSFCRWRHAEGRDVTLKFLRQTVSEALDLASSNLRRPEPFYQRIGEMILKTLEESRAGMTSLSKTYEDDRMFVSRVETLRDMVGVKVAQLKPGGLPPAGDAPAPEGV